MPDLIAIGEPLVEMAAESAGRLGDVDRFRCGWGGDTGDVDRFRCGWGGDTANFVLAAARLGGECGYVTRVGQDAFGRAFVAMLETHGVDASHVKRDEEHHTGLYFVTYSEERKHRFDYVRRGSAASHLAGTDIDPDYVASARVLHASGISQAISPSCADAIRVAMEIAQEADTTVSYDANVRPALGDPETLRRNFTVALAHADIVFVSEEDSAHLFGDTRLSRPFSIASWTRGHGSRWRSSAPMAVSSRTMPGTVAMFRPGRSMRSMPPGRAMRSAPGSSCPCSATQGPPRQGGTRMR